MMLADIASGNADTADVLFLLAAALSGVAAVYAVLEHSVRAALLCVAITLLSLAWLVL